PDDGGLALVGDAYGGDVFCGDAGLVQHSAYSRALGGPDGFGVLLDPAGLRVELREFTLGDGDDGAALVYKYGAGAAGALVEGEDEAHGRVLLNSLGCACYYVGLEMVRPGGLARIATALMFMKGLQSQRNK